MWFTISICVRRVNTPLRRFHGRNRCFTRRKDDVYGLDIRRVTQDCESIGNMSKIGHGDGRLLN